MKASLASLVVAGLFATAVGWAEAEAPTVEGTHRGTGIVVAVAPGAMTVREAAASHTMTTDLGTRTLLTPEDQVSQIGVGDYIAEECVPDGRGGVTAVKLTLYRPAWMEHASPEN